jgi:uncharacterized membrane protein
MNLSKIINDPIFIILMTNFFLSLLANIITDITGIKMLFTIGTIAGGITYHQILRWQKMQDEKEKSEIRR